MNKRVMFLLSAALFLASESPALEIVRNGIPKAAILLSPDASKVEKFAAEEFVSYVKKITGAEIRSATVPVPGLAVIRFRLDTAPDVKTDGALAAKIGQIKSEGFVIETKKNSLLVVSKTEHGIHHGNYFLLKKYGGVEFLHPDEPEIVPKSRAFIIPDQLLLKNPYFSDIRPAGTPSIWTPPHRILWRIRNGSTLLTRPARDTDSVHRGDLREMFDKIGNQYSLGGHCFTPLLTGSWKKQDAERLFAAHPEYFGLRGGKRILSDLSLSDREKLCQPCLSNPAVKALMAANLQKEIDACQGAPVIYKIYNDDHMYWCECAECRKLDDPASGKYGKNSNRYWDLVNYLAETLLPKNPNLRLMAIAYQDYRDVPTKVKPDPRVPVQIAPHGSCYTHLLNDPNCPVNAAYKKMFDDWRKKGAGIYVFEYHNQLPGISRYIPIERIWVDFLRYYHQNGIETANCVVCDGETPYTDQPYYHSYNYKNSWYSRWQQVYMTGYFAWNLYDDFDKVWEKINSLYYGKAWKYIKPYRLLLEKAIKDSGVCMTYGSSAVSTLGKCYELPAVAEHADDLLEKAVKEVENEPIFLARAVREKEFFNRNWKETGFRSIKGAKNMHRIERAASPVKIDGKLDENSWIKASALPGLVTPPRTSGEIPRPATPGTTVKLLFDRENIYFGIKAMKANGKTSDTATSDGLGAMTGSHIEILLMSEFLEGKYYHIAFTRNGHTYSALTTDGRNRDGSKKLDFEYRIADAPGFWTAEVKIPAALLGGIREGDAWKINILRAALNKDGRMQYGMLTETSFHDIPAVPVFAFGSGGPLILNGNFTAMRKAAAPKPPKGKGPEYIWTFSSDQMPDVWNLVSGNPGRLSLLKDTDGTSFIRIENNQNATPMIWQPIQEGSDAKEYFLTLQARGKGTVRASIYYDRNRKRITSRECYAKPDKWSLCSFRFDVSKLPRGRALFLHIAGSYMDIRDVKLVPVHDAEMPDALKHQH